MDGSHFLTVNPATLDDDALWSYGELQKLCKTLALKASGKRNELEKRLTEWHKARTTEGHTVVVDEEGTEKIPLNVDGSNFSLLGMHLKVKSQNGSGCTSPEGAFSVQLGVGSPTVVSPTLLGPLAPSTPVRTPKSALKKTMGNGSEVKANRIKFSPYNATKFIPNRREGNEAWVVDNASLRRTSDDDDDDELDWEAESSGYVDETARINAEKNVFVCSMDGGWENDF